MYIERLNIECILSFVLLLIAAGHPLPWIRLRGQFGPLGTPALLTPKYTFQHVLLSSVKNRDSFLMVNRDGFPSALYDVTTASAERSLFLSGHTRDTDGVVDRLVHDDSLMDWRLLTCSMYCFRKRLPLRPSRTVEQYATAELGLGLSTLILSPF